MSSNRHKCNCDYCVTGRNGKAELQGGGTDWETDEEVLVPYQKKTRRTRKGKPCKKSKTNEFCDFSVKKVYRSYNHYKNGKNMTDYVMTCSRCGKHGSILWANPLF
jgi:hypothetical protein